MTVNITEFLTRVSRDLNEESNAFPTGAWTQAEMLGYLNYAERDFLKLTGIVQTDVSIVAAAGSPILLNRPANTMDINRMSVNGLQIRRQTAWDFELEDRSWRMHTAGRTHYWHEDHLSITQFELNKLPAAGATIRIFADYIYNEYTSVSENLHLKDSWEQYLRWKVISLALGKKGDNQDIGRSKYANQRYQVGVRLARRLIEENPALNIER